MRYNLLISPIAKAEILESTKWYNEQKKGLGLEFISEIEKSIRTIENKPTLFAKIYKEYRMVLIDRFPFEIFYSLESNNIIIHHVFHSSRNPEIWKNN
jgi:toxin ParE1/3/4